jgi:hypothetical protein
MNGSSDPDQEDKMRMLSVVAGAAAALLFGVAPARAQPLIVAEVEAPGINCVFAPSCIITVNDSVGFIPLPYLTAPNTAFLQSRTVPGAPGTPAAGKAGYLYRISLTQAAGTADCLGGPVLNFRPALRLPFKPGQLADVFVITGGGAWHHRLEVGDEIRRRDRVRTGQALMSYRRAKHAEHNLLLRARRRGADDDDPRADLQQRKPAALQRAGARARALRGRRSNA